MRNVTDVIRNTVRAMVVRDGKLLVLEKDGQDQGIRYTLPGGAQDPGETLEQALRRECVEEIGVQVSVGGLAHVAEHFKPVPAQRGTVRHRIEFIFHCEVPADYMPRLGGQPDRSQIGVTWLDMERIDRRSFDPAPLVGYIKKTNSRPEPVYLGMID